MKLIAACLVLLSSLPALAAEPFARSAIDAGDGIVPGQQIRLTVDVFAPGFFTSPPDLPLFDIPDALVTLPEERAQNLVQTVDGVQYSGIRRQYAIVPEKAGSFSVPSIDIEFAYSADGKASTASVHTQAATFEVSRKNGAAAMFSAHDVEISQSFDRDPTKLKVGDALVRTIVVAAKETQAMLIPPVNIGAANGLKQYVKPPRLEDGVSVGRSETESRRTETISYTAEEAGTFSLPPVSYPWFDLDAAGTTEADIPATKIVVGAATAQVGISPELRREGASQFEHRREVALWLSVGLAVLAALWMSRRIASLLLHRLRQLREDTLNSRWYRLRQLRKTVLTADLLEVYAALQGWAAAEGYRTLTESIGSDERLAASIAELERQLFSRGGSDFDRRATASLLGSRSSASTLPKVSALPELNLSR